MEDWKEYKYTELASLIGGGTPKTTEASYWNGNIPWLSVKDFCGNSKYVYKTEKHITELGLRNSSTKLLHRGDIIISARGTVGEIAMLPYDMAFNQSCFGIRANVNVINNHYLYYLTKTKVRELQNSSHGSVFDTITKDTFENINCYIPNINEQIKIAAILSSLDDKIELNRRINGNLEQQAQALYAKAFSSTNTCKMGDVVETTSGGTPSRKNQNYFSSQGIKWIKSKELNGSFIFDSEEHISNDGLCNSSAKLLPPNSTLIAMYGATVGAYGLTIDNATCNQAICALLPNSQYPYTYLYMWAKNNKDELIQKAIGSAQQNISQIIIKNMPVANEKDKIIRFDSDTRYIFSLMRSLAKENYNLIALRDALLPRLMSGELKFNDLNR